MLDIFNQAIFSFISILGYAIIVNLPKKQLLNVSLVGMLGYIVYYIVQDNFKYINDNVQQGLATFVGTSVISLICMVIAYKDNVPLTMLMIPAVITFAPGEQAYLMIQEMILNHSHQGFEWFMQVMLIAMAIVGSVLVAFIARSLYVSACAVKQTKKQ